jgi:hypothetical protein
MNIPKSFSSLLFVLLPLLLIAQANPFLKKYAGAYHLLAFGEETPTAASEKIIFTVDGKWTSSGFPTDENGVVAKVALKKIGTWKASEGLIQISVIEKGSPTVTDFKLDDGLFMSSNSYLKKIFVSNPVFVSKYSGAFNVLSDGEDKPSDFTETISFKADGKCTKSTPSVDDNGVISKTPVITQGTWKANDGVIQVTFKLEGEDRMTEFNLKDGVFADRSGSYLKKVVPPAPPGLYLNKYAGTYHMLSDGQTITPKTDKYVFTPDGKCTWTYFPEGSAPVLTKGTWKASEGLIQMYFSMGDGGGKGDELLSDFKLQDGVFRAEGVFLKKFVGATGTLKKGKNDCQIR